MAHDPAWPPGDGEMARRIRAHDWSATPLGDPATWPQPLRTAAEMMLASPMLATLAVGPARVFLYNDTAARTYGGHHPGALGRPLPDVYPEAFASVAAFYDRVFAGESVHVPAQPLDVAGDGAAEVFDAYLVPVRGGGEGVIAAAMTGFAIGERLRAEALLRGSEERYRAFVTASTDAVYRMSADWRHMYRLDGRGFLADTTAPDEGWRERYILPEDRDEIAAVIERAIATRSMVDAEHRVIRADGTIGWAHSRAVPVVEGEGGGGGGIVEWLGTASDVTDRRRTERRRAFLLAFSDAMRREADAEALIEVGTRMLGERLRASRVVFAEIDEAAGLAHIRQGWTDAGAERHPAVLHLAEFDGPLLDDLRAGRTVRYDDVGDAPCDRPDLAAMAAIGIRAGLSVPLMVAGRFVVNISVHQHSPRRWTDDEVALVEEVAERLWPAVERARAEAGRRDSEVRLAAAFEGVPVGLAAIDLDGRSVLANAEYRRFLPSGIVPSRDPERGGRWKAWDWDGRPVAPRDFPAARALRGERVVPGVEMLHQDAEGRPVWTTVATVPTYDEAGGVTGVVTAISDISERKRAEQALRDSEAERRTLIAEMSEGFCILEVILDAEGRGVDYRFLETNPAFVRQGGFDPAGRLMSEIAPIEPIWPAAYGRVASTGVPERIVDAAAAFGRIYDVYAFRIGAAADRRIAVFFSDVTVRKRQELALRDSEERLRLVVELVPALLWWADAAGQEITVNARWVAYTGQPEAETHGFGWLDAIHPEDRAATRAAFEHAFTSGEPLEREQRIRRADGRHCWHLVRHVPVRGEDGAIAHWFGAAIDVDDLHRLQERQQVLVTELQHRTFNLMGVIRSMADATVRSSGSLDEFRLRFRDRVDALARAQRLLSRIGENNRVTFDELIRNELAAAGTTGQDGRLTLEGPPGIALRSSTVQTFAMALHELTTNALKYGALRQPGAHLDVRWRVERGDDGQPWLHVAWTETGVAMPPSGTDPVGTGQGRTLIEGALPYQLNARTSFELGPDGVRCTISLPVSQRNGAGREGGDA